MGGCRMAVAIGSACVVLAVASCSSFASSPSDPTSGEGGVTPTTDAGRFCAAHDGGTTVFCDDFDDPDRGNIEHGGWSQQFAFPTGSIASDVFASAPRSARFDFDAGRAGATLSLPASTQRVVVHAKIQPAPGSDGARVLDLDYDVCSLQLGVGGDLNAYCKDAFIGAVSDQALRAGAFTTVVLTIDRTSTGMHASVQIGEGGSSVTRSLDVPAQLASPAVVELQIGNLAADATGTLWYDDVWVESN